MKHFLVLWITFAVCQTICSSNHHQQADIEDNEFAEFEEFDDEDGHMKAEPADTDDKIEESPAKAESEDFKDINKDDDEAIVEEEEDSEFEYFQDDEEFEGFDQDNKPTGKPKEKPDLKITKVPLHFRANWDSFYLEMLMVAGLLIYFINFITGRTTNQKLAQSWFASHKQLLEQNFHLVGDDGKTTENENPGLVKESENVYTLWCSGRVCVEGMLVELRFIKRQDLIHSVAQLMRPINDQVTIRVTMNPDDMDMFVFAIANKKTSVQLAKDMADISIFCPEKKPVDKFGLPSSFVMMSEIGEVTSAMLDAKVAAVLNKFEECIDYIHFSDQYSGSKVQDDSQSKLPEVSKVLIFSFNVPGHGRVVPENMETMLPLLKLIFHCIDKVKRFKLSKEAKVKAEKNRLRVEENFLKTTHQQRADAAQMRREERRRAEKERMMKEEDPDKQRKWEEKEHRREMKKRTPKMKQLRVKAL